MILKTATGQALPTSIVRPSDGEDLLLFSTNENGTPVPCFWTLTPAGAQTTSPKGVKFFASENATMWIGSLDNFYSATPTPVITVGPAYSTSYRAPTDLVETQIYCTITAIPTDGSTARQLQITVVPPAKGSNF